MFTAIQTKTKFEELLGLSQILSTQVVFIIDTLQIYTHGIYINSATFGTELNGYVNLTIAGTTKALALSSHTHSNYYDKNSNIDIGSNKIVSGEYDALYLSQQNTFNIGNTSLALKLNSNSSVSILKGSTLYTMLDTENFTISQNKDSQDHTLQNAMTFNYNGSKIQLDYVRKINGNYAFNDLGYTSAGITTVSQTNYGILTMHNDSNIWALLRINIADSTLEIRDSSHTNWTALISGAYLPLGGGEMKGPLTWKNSEALPKQTDPQYFLVIDAFADGGTTKWATKTDVKGVLLGNSPIGSTQDPVYWNGSALVACSSLESTLSAVDLSTTWLNIDNLSTKLSSDGSYAIQITYASCIYTGVFSYVSTSTMEDEILLHASGTIDSVGGIARGRLYAKVGTYQNKAYLKLATTLNENNAVLTIKYKKLI